MNRNIFEVPQGCKFAFVIVRDDKQTAFVRLCDESTVTDALPVVWSVFWNLLNTLPAESELTKMAMGMIRSRVSKEDQADVLAIVGGLAHAVNDLLKNENE